MKAKGISQERLAELLEMSQPGVSSWLRGATQPSLDDINRIADLLGASRLYVTHGFGPESADVQPLYDAIASGALSKDQISTLVSVAVQFRAMRAADALASAPTETRQFAGTPPAPKKTSSRLT